MKFIFVQKREQNANTHTQDIKICSFALKQKRIKMFHIHSWSMDYYPAIIMCSQDGIHVKSNVSNKARASIMECHVKHTLSFYQIFIDNNLEIER